LQSRIIFENVSKIFETRYQTIEAVKDFNMEISEGEFVSIIGPSGCGKSTLIRMLDNIIKPSSGKIFIDGIFTNRKKEMDKDILRRIGFIFQQPNLLPWYTVRQNVALPLKIFKLKGDKWEKRVDDLIAMAGLGEYKNAFPIEISGGIGQRVGVIRAMVHDPEIMLMDEPFGALDELTREKLDMELLEIWQKNRKTIIFITHSVEEAILLSERVYVMGTRPGRLIETVTIDLPAQRTLDMTSDEIFLDYKKKLIKIIGEIDLSKIK
jgi:NitT/TauT family transport system ATP-binding protein